MSKQGELEPLHLAVIPKEGGGWHIRATRYSMPIGPRLLKRTEAMPDIPTEANTAEELAERVKVWQDWLTEEHLLASKKGRKKRRK
ncbi:MAG: hypothetical protein CMF45_08920 [Legionellales bacterium]|nr:hypothetical protein [Legionellales bacterium]